VKKTKKRNKKSEIFFSDFSMSGPKNLVIIIWILRGERLGVIDLLGLKYKPRVLN